jgi:hypothetical protein
MPTGLKRGKYKHREHEQYGQQREQPVGMFAPQSAYLAYGIHDYLRRSDRMRTPIVLDAP